MDLIDIFHNGLVCVDIAQLAHAAELSVTPP